MARGTGCPGPDNGGAIEFVDPQGAAFWGEGGGAALEDGTWELQTRFPVNSPPGRYTVKASCGGNAGPMFSYPPVSFSVTE